MRGRPPDCDVLLKLLERIGIIVGVSCGRGMMLVLLCHERCGDLGGLVLKGSLDRVLNRGNLAWNEPRTKRAGSTDRHIVHLQVIVNISLCVYYHITHIRCP